MQSYMVQVPKKSGRKTIIFVSGQSKAAVRRQLAHRYTPGTWRFVRKAS